MLTARPPQQNSVSRAAALCSRLTRALAGGPPSPQVTVDLALSSCSTPAACQAPGTSASSAVDHTGSQLLSHLSSNPPAACTKTRPRSLYKRPAPPRGSCPAALSLTTMAALLAARRSNKEKK